jgi:hypothetical protein
MRDRETIDCELRLLTAVRGVCREHGTLPSIGPVNGQLDERAELTGSSPLGHQPRDRVHYEIAEVAGGGNFDAAQPNSR